MSKLDTMKMMSETIEKGIVAAKELGYNLKEDNFTVIQQFGDNQFIKFEATDDDQGERTTKIEVSPNLIILEPIEGTLSIYESSDEEGATNAENE